MARKLVFTLSLFVLATVLTGATFASVVPTVIFFGGPTSGNITVAHNSVTFSGPSITGFANQAGNSGVFTLTGATVSFPSSYSPITSSPASQFFSVTINGQTVAGNLTLTGVQPIIFTFGGHTYNYGDAFGGLLDITQSTPGFVHTGFPTGATVLVDFTVQPNGKFSSGELSPLAVPEPGTIALLGSGLLAAAGMLRRKF